MAICKRIFSKLILSVIFNTNFFLLPFITSLREEKFFEGPWIATQPFSWKKKCYIPVGFRIYFIYNLLTLYSQMQKKWHL